MEWNRFVLKKEAWGRYIQILVGISGKFVVSQNDWGGKRMKRRKVGRQRREELLTIFILAWWSTVLSSLIPSPFYTPPPIQIFPLPFPWQSMFGPRPTSQSLPILRQTRFQICRKIYLPTFRLHSPTDLDSSWTLRDWNMIEVGGIFTSFRGGQAWFSLSKSGIKAIYHFVPFSFFVFVKGNSFNPAPVLSLPQPFQRWNANNFMTAIIEANSWR